MLKFPLFQGLHLTHAITNVEDGNVDSRFGRQEEVDKNLDSICQKLTLDKHSIIQMEQVHKCNVVAIDCSACSQVITDADALITSDPRVILMVRVADCVPIMIYDEHHHAIGLVHSGWRGTMGKILLATIQKMMVEYSSHPSHLKIALGPSVQPQSNNWDDVPIQADFPEWGKFIGKKANAHVIDLPGFIKQTALHAGVFEDNIFSSDIDTVSDTNYFSYLRSKRSSDPEGRFAAFIQLHSR